jgi:hypothetical protein
MAIPNHYIDEILIPALRELPNVDTDWNAGTIYHFTGSECIYTTPNYEMNDDDVASARDFVPIYVDDVCSGDEIVLPESVTGGTHDSLGAVRYVTWTGDVDDDVDTWQRVVGDVVSWLADRTLGWALTDQGWTGEAPESPEIRYEIDLVRRGYQVFRIDSETVEAIGSAPCKTLEEAKHYANCNYRARL